MWALMFTSLIYLPMNGAFLATLCCSQSETPFNVFCGGVGERWNPAHNLHENRNAFQLPSNLEGLFLGGGGGILHGFETN